ncbi:MAG: hypothetical protein K0S26_1589 [Bacteroidota bacterium]|nr:hypothetical protein [Bacteroidota bacterium]
MRSFLPKLYLKIKAFLIYYLALFSIKIFKLALFFNEK